jgi:type III restriction enzyme
MNAHPSIPYDPALLTEVSDRLDLRVPNAEALDAVARRFDEADGQPFEVVCDLATAVGKTYLAAGLIEYLADAGVRNVLIVVPGSTILNKTVSNFTDGHQKSLTSAMSADPLMITAETFNTGRVAAALDNEDHLKLYVFTVQSLIRPKAKTSRKVRDHQEWLGTGLYQRLKDADDLVVIADEHHVYSEKARSFHDAVRDLDPMALIGLTATPAEADRDNVIYDYPLARAIADQYVKTPVLVGRKDKLTGVDVQLRDGLRLLDAKQTAANAYADATGKSPVNAVMFVVADTIDNANAIHETLRKPDLLGEDYGERVLVITSESPDESLARLDAVEDPASKVRVIVSVSMLKEGWDVKNIYVICSFRPSISEALTEQTLGRGLRLPWGAYTGIELLDTVEILSHERYQELLERAGVLLEGLTGQRAAAAVAVPTAYRGHQADGGDQAGEDDTLAVYSTAGLGADEAGDERPDSPLTEAALDAGGGVPAEAVSGFLISGAENRLGTAAGAALALQQRVEASKKIQVPKLERLVSSSQFSLSDIDDDTFRDLGRRLAAEGGSDLDRKILNVIEDPNHPSGLRLVPAATTDRIEASAPNLPFPEARRRLIDTLLALDEVAETKSNINAAGRLADAVIDGAGNEAALAAQFNAVLDAVRITIRQRHREAPAQIVDTWTTEPFAPTRLTERPEEPNRYGPFSRKVAYSGWTRSLHPYNWFDSEPERRFANLVDDEDDVALWARILRGELTIPWEGGRYHPDFYVQGQAGGEHYLVEVKADKDLDNPDVQAKRDAARAWARRVTDEGDQGVWHYLLVSQSAVENSSTLAALRQQAT